ncbi:MAG: phosphoribosyl-AMP cyclohydrolase [Elusimicrobia bacterium]|nr:phosphoribosyl-AMP cyclohydrolase [Candidatus Obscuribacterium magneticum]
MSKKNEISLSELKFDERGLIPVVTQDAKDGTVLMVAYMNLESLRKTLESGLATYWSRSRQKLWLKGESSGNVQKVTEIYTDCDGDTLLIKVEQVGKAACHTGRRSCFYRRAKEDGSWDIISEPLFDPDKVYKKK